MASGGSSEYRVPNEGGGNLNVVPNRVEEYMNEPREPEMGAERQPRSLRHWPTITQLRVAVSKLRQDLDELQSPVLPSLPGDRMEESVAESPRLGLMRSVGSGPLAFYHRGVAVRMLRDYLQDLVVLNNWQLEGGTGKNVLQPRLQTVQTRIEEYRAALEEMVDVNEREPDGQLTWKERDILKRMLEDYSSGLEEFLDSPDDLGGLDKLEDQLAMVRARIDLVDAGMPLDFSETRFDIMIDSLSASLEGCKTQVLEVSQLRGFEVFNFQCEFLVDCIIPNCATILSVDLPVRQQYAYQ